MKIKKFNIKNWCWYAYLKLSEEEKMKYYEEAKNLAGEWVTCACGQLCKYLPRYILLDRMPQDDILINLGCNFSIYIDRKDWDKALKVLNKIEERTINYERIRI